MNTNENPKCSTCRTYFIPTLKTSGLPYKCCDKCRKISLKSKNDNKCEHNRIRNYIYIMILCMMSYFCNDIMYVVIIFIYHI